MPLSRFAFCLFCDDIRPEIGNKFSYMGVYQRDMVFPPGAAPGVPIFVPKFGIGAWVVSDINDRPKHIVFRVFGPPGRTEIGHREIDVAQISNPPEMEPGSLRFSVSVVMPLIGLMLPESGFIEVTAEVDGEEMRAGRLKVTIPRPAIEEETISASAASQPPSEQSPEATRKRSLRARGAAP